MQFNDCGIIISLKKYGENSLIMKLLSSRHGIYRGFVRSAKSKKGQAIFQIGNLISFEYRSRVEENLGSFAALDLVKSYCSKIIFDKLKLSCAGSLFSIIDSSFLEKEKQDDLFLEVQSFLQRITEEEIGKKQFLADYVRLELLILKVLGYEIDLSSCAATNTSYNLAFVSPKSARAVSFDAGRPYENKLLKLPAFLINDCESTDEQLSDGFKLSGFFLNKFVFEEKKIIDGANLLHRNNIIKNL